MDNYQRLPQSPEGRGAPLANLEPKKTKRRWILILVISMFTISLLTVSSGFLYVKFLNNKSIIQTKNNQVNTSENTSDVRVVFVVYEGSDLKVYSSSINGKDKKVLISKDITGLTKALPNTIASIQISPNKNFIAYKLSSDTSHTVDASAPVFLIDSQGRNNEKIIDNVGNFHWFPSQEAILYTVPTKKAWDQGGDLQIEAPLYGPGAEWHIFNLKTKSDNLLVLKDYDFTDLVGWVDNNNAIFVSTSAYGGVAQRLYVYNFETKKAKEVNIPEEYTQINQISTNPSSSKTVISFLPKDYGAQYSCDFFEIKSSGELGKHIVSSKDYACGKLSWNGNNELYYEKGTGPHGIISTKDTNEFGRYIIPAVYKYNFETEKEEQVLGSNNVNNYGLQDILPNKNLVTLSTSKEGTSGVFHSLETRDLNGKNPHLIWKGSQYMQFVGWVK